jgi:hypothetical protein
MDFANNKEILSCCRMPQFLRDTCNSIIKQSILELGIVNLAKYFKTPEVESRDYFCTWILLNCNIISHKCCPMQQVNTSRARNHHGHSTISTRHLTKSWTRLSTIFTHHMPIDDMIQGLLKGREWEYHNLPFQQTAHDWTIQIYSSFQYTKKHENFLEMPTNLSYSTETA